MSNVDKSPRVRRSEARPRKSSAGPRAVPDVLSGLSRSSSGTVLFYATPVSGAALTLPVFVSGLV